MNGTRYLVVTADDFGIGLPTSQGILDLATRGLVTGAVLLVNSPFAEQAVRAWDRAGRPMPLGWHPCLTLDRPLLPRRDLPSLVGPDGRFWPLAPFLRRAVCGRLVAAEIEQELAAQLQRFRQLVGGDPPFVNAHHHIQVFPSIGNVLRSLLGAIRPRPYVRRIREPLATLVGVPGARSKRLLLNLLGRRDARRWQQAGFPGNDWLAGITDPPRVAREDFLRRWLTRIPGTVVELTCHPGYLDMTLLGRDCTAADGQLPRRVCELHLLQQAEFSRACAAAGFVRVSPVALAVSAAPAAAA